MRRTGPLRLRRHRPVAAVPIEPAAPTPVCRAPFTSLHLDPSGHVRVCELNSLAMLGRIPEARLVDLWTGRRADRIRQALTAGDLRMGCEDCATHLTTGDRALAHASYYDRFDGPLTTGDWPRQLELSLSNACNLQCVMCNGDLSSAIRTHREGLPPLPTVYGDEFFDDLSSFLPHLERVTFIGGEPFLGAESLRVFDMLVDLGRPVVCQVTTNGTVYTPRVERILRALPVEVSISIDGATGSTYEAIRVGSDHAKVLENLERFREHAAALSVNYCLMPQNWQELAPFLAWAGAKGLWAHVNTVTAPRRFSLYHLSPHDLAAVLAGLEQQERDGLGDLGPNRSVWDQQVARLRSHLRHLTDTTASTPVSTPVTLGPTAADLAAQWADERGVHQLDIGASEQILAIRPDPGDVLGMDLTANVGGHLTSLVQALTAEFGDPTSSELDYRAGGIEVRDMAFERTGERTEVRAVLGGGDPTAVPPITSRWHLAARTTARAEPR